MKIGNVSFTNREIDVISCVVNGRSAKYIGVLLDISPRTVSVHIANIAKKIECNSQEQIINFIENTNFYNIMRRHYVYLTHAMELKKQLSSIKLDQSFGHYYFYKNSNSDFVENTKMFLEALGESVIEIKELKDVNLDKDSFIFTGHENAPEMLKTKATKVFFKDFKDKKSKDFQIICSESYFFKSFLDVASAIYKRKEFSELSKTFHESYRKKFYDNKNDKKIPNFKKYIAIAVLAAGLAFWAGKEMDFSSPRISNIGIIEHSKILERKDILAKIDDAIESNTGIAVITGEGGSGKTVIARKYLSISKCKIAWEINAESEESIAKSFTSLAIALGKKKELSLILAISEREVQISQLLNLISTALKSNNWILLYDNVENLNEIAKYFPSLESPKRKIIVTTRNANVKNSIFLEDKNVIDIGVLNKKEKTELFSKILGTKFPMENLIREIPSLPLDICAAAYYMKETGDSGDDYLGLIRKSDVSFYKNQEKLLDNNLNYAKTRYSIVVSSLKKLLDGNEEYKKLAFLLAMLNSQDISKDYFYKISDSFVSNQFIYDLKKYSIITDQDNSVSIHRVSQDITLNYMLKTLSLDQILEFLEEIVEKLCSYKDLAWFLYEVDKPGLGILKTNDIYMHLFSLFNNIDKLSIPNDEKAKFKIRVNLAIFHASKYVKSTKDIIALGNSIISQNEQYKVLNDLDFAVLYEACGHKNINVDNDLALKYFKKCLEMCKSIKGSKCLKSICLADYANARAFKNDIETVKDCLNKAFEILTPADCFWKKQARVTVFNRFQECLSEHYVTSKELLDVIRVGEKLLKEFEADQFFYKTKSYTGDRDLSVYMIRRNMVAVYNRMGKVDEALENIKEAKFFLDRFSEKESSIIKHKCLLGIDYGCVLLKKGNVQDAIDVLNNAIGTKEKILDFTEIPVGYLFRAEAFIRLGKYNEALKDCKKFLKIKQRKGFESNTEKSQKSMALFNLAVVSYKQGDAKNAKKHLTELLKTGREFCESILSKDAFAILEQKKTFTPSDDVKECFDKAKTILASIRGDDHPDVVNYFSKIV